MPKIVISFDTADGPTAGIDAISGALAQILPLGVRAADDDTVLTVTAAVEGLGRAVDALRIECAAEVGERSRVSLGTASLAAKKGCGSPAELLTRVTRTSASSARSRLKLGGETRAQLSLSGVEFPARFPRIAAALEAGTLGVDSAQAILAGLVPIIDNAAIDEIAAAETELVASATGVGSDAAVPCPADEIRVQAQVWKSVLDPDGLEPSEERMMQKRGFTLPRERGGLLCGTYALMPEVGGRFIRMFDACQSPKSAPAFLRDEELAEQNLEADPRTPEQLRHDVVAAMVDSFARSGEAPTIGGAAPTVLVSVRESDLARGRGAGWIDGVDEPVSFRTVKQAICTGGTQLVRFDEAGRIIELGSPQRCFTPAQRKAITLRDGGCIIPGCNIPPAWTEIHHVVPDADGGPTHTDNGVLLCWFHHRSIETSGWLIRMVGGVPQIKAPPWIEWDSPWRIATKSKTRRADLL
ncbi:MAG TPA: DUF222 domain-containing protein [Homoserinimonas sp.]|nr:DUF222 domain-containing protein [Homoserinimonas sp.]